MRVMRASHLAREPPDRIDRLLHPLDRAEVAGVDAQYRRRPRSSRGDLPLEPEEDVVAGPLPRPGAEHEVVVEAELLDLAAPEELDRLLGRPHVHPAPGRRALVVQPHLHRTLLAFVVLAENAR